MRRGLPQASEMVRSDHFERRTPGAQATGRAAAYVKGRSRACHPRQAGWGGRGEARLAAGKRNGPIGPFRATNARSPSDGPGSRLRKARLPRALRPRLAGAEGIEPSNAGIKIQCLTTWRRPNPRGPGRDHIEQAARLSTRQNTENPGPFRLVAGPRGHRYKGAPARAARMGRPGSSESSSAW